MKLFYTGPNVTAELLVVMLENHGITSRSEFEEGGRPAKRFGSDRARLCGRWGLRPRLISSSMRTRGRAVTIIETRVFGPQLEEKSSLEPLQFTKVATAGHRPALHKLWLANVSAGR
jgi:hypothetical protein